MLMVAKRETGLPIVTELMEFKDIDLFNEVDVIQIGARNMQNFNLLKEVGTYTKKPMKFALFEGRSLFQPKERENTCDLLKSPVSLPLSFHCGYAR